LALFRRLIVQRDKAKLTHYANLALNAVINHAHGGGPILTTSLVQGSALGGGFEAALAGHTIVAEKRCRFGFPEILFGLFPGMGAYTLLRRRISAREAKEVITGGGTWLAEDLHRLGVVDHLCEQGEGEAFVTKMLSRHSRKPGLTRFLRVASRLSDAELDEMRRITDEWVSAALDLSEEYLARMDKIVAYQHRVNMEAAKGPIVTIRRIGEQPSVP